MRTVDANVLVRLIIRDDPSQTASAESFIEKGAWVPALALAEAIWVLATVYQWTATDSATAIEMLLKHRDLVLEDHETVEAALKIFRVKPALGFSDCLILESARRAGHLPLGTFDRRLAKTNGAQKL